MQSGIALAFAARCPIGFSALLFVIPHMSSSFDPSLLGEPRFRDAFAYWDSKRGIRSMPSRRDIDPVEIPRLLPYVMLVDVLRDPLDFRYRLIGTEVRDILRGDYTGKRYTEVPGKGPGSTVWSNYETVVMRKAPVLCTPPYVGPDRQLRRCDSLLMPLSDDGAAVNMVLNVIAIERDTN